MTHQLIQYSYRWRFHLCPCLDQTGKHSWWHCCNMVIQGLHKCECIHINLLRHYHNYGDNFLTRGKNDGQEDNIIWKFIICIHPVVQHYIIEYSCHAWEKHKPLLIYIYMMGKPKVLSNKYSCHTQGKLKPS